MNAQGCGYIRLGTCHMIPSCHMIPPTHQQALNLLDSEYCDEQVRSFATLVLERLPDDQLEDVLLQLTQVRGRGWLINPGCSWFV